jgi:hypothetical protein
MSTLYECLVEGVLGCYSNIFIPHFEISIRVSLRGHREREKERALESK